MKILRNGFDFNNFYLDRIYRIIRIFFACGEGPFGRRPHYPDDPIDPVPLFFIKIRIHSSFCCILKVSVFDQTGRFQARGNAEP